ncbi:hypothetical protein Hanom_Chr04g00324011 [Helianthus anomalus]
MSTLQGMNKVTIFEAKLSVSVAKFDKNHRLFQQKNYGSVAGQYQGPTEDKGNWYSQKRPIYEYKTVKHGRMFSDVVRGSGEPQAKENKTIVAEERVAVYPDHCMIRAVIMELKDVEALKVIRKALDVWGYGEYPVSYLGGLKCMIVFKEKGQAMEFIKSGEDERSQLISSAVLWKGQDLQYDRLAWVKTIGIPIHLRDSKLYNAVGGCFGRVVGLSDFSWVDIDSSDNGCWVITDMGKHIDKEVNLVWSGKEYKVWVREEQNTWLKTAIAELSGEGRVSPMKTTESAAAPGGSLEEGEIRSGGNGGQNVEDHPREPEPTSPMHVLHCNQENETINKAAEVTKELGKDFNNEGGRSQVKENMGEKLKVSTDELGQDPQTKSRKRPRRARSPQCLSPEEGIESDPPPTHIRNLERAFDLNNETRLDGDYS